MTGKLQAPVVLLGGEPGCVWGSMYCVFVFPC